MSYLDNKHIDITEPYKLKFNFCYIDCDNFKERELLSMRHIIGLARIGHELIFDKYANISFDDKDPKHKFPIITELQNFSRGKTNGIVFKMNETVLNDSFNRCLIYQTVTKTSGFYGYVFYNTETGLYTHTYNVDYDISSLIIHIMQSLEILSHKREQWQIQ